MDTMKRWIIILAFIVFAGMLFADKILSFYIDWLWFGQLGFESVLWTVVGSQLGLGLVVGVLYGVWVLGWCMVFSVWYMVYGVGLMVNGVVW